MKEEAREIKEGKAEIKNEGEETEGRELREGRRWSKEN